MLHVSMLSITCEKIFLYALRIFRLSFRGLAELSLKLKLSGVVCIVLLTRNGSFVIIVKFP